LKLSAAAVILMVSADGEQDI